MKIALCQLNTTVGDLEGNLNKVLDFLKKAEKAKADLAVFPELTLSGYPPYDLLDREDFIKANEKIFKVLLKKVKRTAILIGHLAYNKEKTGKPLLNSASLIHHGKVLGTYSKKLLPTYDVFDEARYFAEGQNDGVFSFKGKKIGVSICEDIWSEQEQFDSRIYENDPLQTQVNMGADFLVNLSASPYSMGKNSLKIKFLKKKLKKYSKPLFYVNLVGANDELVFDGLTKVFNAKADLISELSGFQEDFKTFTLSNLKKSKLDKVRTEDEILDALILGLKDYMNKSGFSKAIIGLSGGMDSSLVAWIAREALGAKNVLGVAMPSHFSSDHSIADAKSLAKSLGIQFRVHAIKSLYDSFKAELELNETKNLSLALQNLQARIRGNILMTLSNQEGRLLLTTGNKSELAVGYCTLYGDMAGGLALISDLPKTLVYKVARAANRRLKAIPENVFRKPPSAELAPGQNDQDDLPSYEVLDAFLKHYIEEHLDPKDFHHPELSKKKLKWLISKIDSNEYKRRQAAPGIRVTTKAFGVGRRIPIVNRYRSH